MPLVSYLRPFHIRMTFLFKRLIIYAIHKIINPKNVGSRIWEKCAFMQLLTWSQIKMFESMKFSIYAKICWFILSGNSNNNLRFLLVPNKFFFCLLSENASSHRSWENRSWETVELCRKFNKKLNFSSPSQKNNVSAPDQSIFNKILLFLWQSWTASPGS